MIQSIKKSMVMLLLVTVFLSCNQGPTLQTYYVDNELKPGFISGDVPASFINLEGVDLTEDQREAYESVDKLNILAFKADDKNTEEYKTELGKVKTILKDEKYEELMRGSTSDGKFSIKFIGDSEASIDELILFGSSSDQGFIVVRVLGDDMNAGKLMKLSDVLQKADIDNEQLNSFKDFFK
ncbi:DUF4252 domain-containing protein [Winogradskyella sp. SYSU M77433]|uniref:DUF4252 domain-containing protein n=1 Tax=Winogradskyella sp. SYSU M77433 TaxID=3042722 RepID=UPI002480A089|nr:DUF4252 domain-containing protein [Winogradskyella sp. SYSU M77433]MDH7914188.1 DUF4252 domain-containing protein [Winogradskyella sp. SYSU M77433]